MKIAVVLSGYFGTISTNNMTTGRISHKKIKEFFGNRDVDYFIHSWQMSAKDEVIELYNPKKSFFESQIDFNIIAKENDLDQNWFDEGFNRPLSMYKRATIYNSLSFFYSRSNALKLLDETEYDRIFVMRLDIGNVGPREVNFPHTFKFDSDISKIYSPYWNQLNIGLGDMWTIMNIKNARTLSTIYDKALNYYKKDSDYVDKMLNGFPMSEKYDFNIPSPKASSNVCLTDRTPELMTYPKWYCVNNHSLYKYFFIDTDMFKDLNFI